MIPMSRASLIPHALRSAALGAVLAGVLDAWTTPHAFFGRSLPFMAVVAWLVVALPAGLMAGLLAAALASRRAGARTAPESLAALVVAAALVLPAWILLLVHANVAWLAEDAGRDALLVDGLSALAALLLTLGLGALLARAFSRGGTLRFLFATWRGAAVLAAVLLIVTFGAWRGGVGAVGPPQTTAPAGAPDVVIVLIDTLRRDHLSGEGYARETSPELDALAQRGTKFPSFVSQSCYTKPSVASLFTSRLPSGHRVGHLTTVLAEGQTTLAERFHAAGWRTGIFCANTIVGPEFGFAQGAEIFRTLPTELVPRTKLGYALFRLSEGERRIPPVLWLRSALSRLEQVSLGRSGAETLSLPASQVVRDYDAWRAKQGEDPCFAYLHVMEPHAPYEPPADLARLFAPQGEPLYAHPPAAISGFPPFARGDSLAPDRVAGLVRAYDAEIRGVDRELGALYASLAASRRPTILAVTADHGEEFFEHGGWRHGQSLHGEMLDVPLVLTGPGVPMGRRVAGGQLIDLGPTLLELAGLPAPDDVSGRSLVPQLRAAAAVDDSSLAAGAVPSFTTDPGATASVGREAVAEIVYGDAYWSRSLTRGPLKVIESRLGSRDAIQLFDLGADPGELRDLAAAEPALATALRTRLAEIVAAAAKGAPEGESGEFDPATRERLRALGYVQ